MEPSDPSAPPSSSASRGALRIGVDTGGTFTDLVVLDGETRRTGKVPSTPDDPARGVLRGLEELNATGGEIVHGTTVALNALLTGRTARAALVTNEGFRDLIEIGRQERSEIYALHPQKPRALVDRQLRFEIAQRSWPDADGQLVDVAVPEAKALETLARQVADSRAEAVAVCLLHAYSKPEIETRVADALAGLDVPVSCSASILRSYREYERFSTCVANAALIPVVRAYLSRLERTLPRERLSILQSSGGTLGAEVAAFEPVRILFSGPAGGVIGAADAAREAGLGDIVTFDMGGTSTDVAFHSPGAGATNTTTSSMVAGHPIAVPALDLHTIGCGGGSLVHVDAGGILHVGPESAGAAPGPVCYGEGNEPTVTDAHVFLGHIAAEGFLGGRLALDVDAVARAFEALGRQLGVSPHLAAQGVLDVARAAIRRAVGVMTMQRGHDPLRLPLVAFGGAGGLSAAAVAGSLHMPGALVPAAPGVLSASGMAGADAVRDHDVSILGPLRDWNAKRRKEALRELAERGRRELLDGGATPDSIDFEFLLDLRYAGQSFEIAVPEGKRPDEAFENRHEELYGWRLERGEVELVTLRARAVARQRAATSADTPPAPLTRREAPPTCRSGERAAWFGSEHSCVRIARERLEPGDVIHGPAIVEEYSGTTLVPPAWSALTTRGGHLWMTHDGESAEGV